MTRNINDLMPKLQGLQWGAISNIIPTIANIKELNKMMPHDGKWHTLFEMPNEIILDDVPIKRVTAERLT